MPATLLKSLSLPFTAVVLLTGCAEEPKDPGAAQLEAEQDDVQDAKGDLEDASDNVAEQKEELQQAKENLAEQIREHEEAEDAAGSAQRQLQKEQADLEAERQDPDSAPADTTPEGRPSTEP